MNNQQAEKILQLQNKQGFLCLHAEFNNQEPHPESTVQYITISPSIFDSEGTVLNEQKFRAGGITVKYKSDMGNIEARQTFFDLYVNKFYGWKIINGPTDEWIKLMPNKNYVSTRDVFNVFAILSLNEKNGITEDEKLEAAFKMMPMELVAEHYHG